MRTSSSSSRRKFRPKDDDEIEKALGEVYKIRKRATHSGLPYPTVPPSGRRLLLFKAWSALFTKEHPFPPIGWFEGVVNNAIYNYLRRELGDARDAKAVTTVTTGVNRGRGEAVSLTFMACQAIPEQGQAQLGSKHGQAVQEFLSGWVRQPSQQPFLAPAQTLT